MNKQCAGESRDRLVHVRGCGQVRVRRRRQRLHRQGRRVLSTGQDNVGLVHLQPSHGLNNDVLPIRQQNTKTKVNLLDKYSIQEILQGSILKANLFLIP